MNDKLLSILMFLSAKGIVVSSSSQSVQAKIQTEQLSTLQNELKEKASPKFDFQNLLKRTFDGNRISAKMLPQESAKISHRKDLKQGKRAPKNAVHEVVIAVKQNNLVELEKLVNDVSDPKSANYGKHLTKEQLTKMTSNPVSSKHIADFLKLSGAIITKKSKYQDYITATAPVSVWEELMATEFFEFEHVEDKHVKMIRAMDYSLPENLASHVSAVFNTVQFPDEFVLRKKLHTLPAGKTARPHVVPAGATPSEVLVAGYVTPALLNNFYNISSNTGNALGSQCVYESLNQTYSPSDLTAFQNYFQLPVESVAVDIGGHADDNACTLKQGGFDHCGEANLDVQYMMAVSQVTPTTYWYTDEENFMLDWVTLMADMDAPPLVNSVSYSSYELGLSPAYAASFNTEAMKLAAMGVTLLSASGDDGVAGYLARGQPLFCGYYPQFPASSPYVTAVGGTMGPEINNGPEIACTSDAGGVITTGGGFSGLYPRPAWQNTAVTNYFAAVSNTNNAPFKGYQATGRGYPDVSLLAAWYDVMAAGHLSAVFGTSASTPVFAGFVSLVNAKRLAAGKSALGWINPSLYALYETFINDITVGENNCVASEELCCEQGYTAVAGWDPVTGLGSVNYGKFEEAFLALGSLPGPGEPTGAPAEAPTMAPTPVATAAPTVAAGWIYVNDYPGEECVNTAVSTVGVATGLCSVTYNKAGNPNGSVKYSCGDVFATVYRFSDNNCQDYLEGHSYFLGCAENVQDSYAVITYAQSLECVANHDVLPIPLTANYIMQSNYNGDTCNTPVSSFVATATGHCFNYGTASSGLSFKYESDPLVQKTFRGLNCKTLYTTNSFDEDQCMDVEYSPEQDDFYGHTFGTSKLSAMVTYVSSADNYQFTVSQTLSDISVSAYNNNLQANDQAVVATVSASLAGIPVENIVITEVVAAASASVVSSSSVVAALRRALQSTTDTTVTYTVNYNYATLGYSSGGAAYTALTNQLYLAVSSGAFTTSLNAYAAANNVVDMTTASATTAPVVSNYTTLLVNDDLVASDDSDDNSSSVLGLALGLPFGLLFLCCVCGGCFYCNRSNASGQRTRSEAPMSAQAHHHQAPQIAHAQPINENPIHKL